MQKKDKKSVLLSISSLIVTTLYPVLFMYFKNIYEARERHLVIISLIYICVAAIVFFSLFICKKRINMRTMISNTILVILLNYELVASSLGYFLSTILSVLLLLFIVFLSKKMAEDTIYSINGIWTFTLIVILLFDFVPVAPYMVKKLVSHIPSAASVVDFETDQIEHNDSEPTNHDVKEASIADITDYPNVYIMIFDEYGGYENLIHYYDYDNSDFLNQLKNMGFNTSQDSYNVESVSTITNIPNLYNLDYVVDHENEYETFLDHLMNPYIYQYFKNKGYDINTSSYPAFLDNTQSTLNYDTKELYEDTIGYFILKNSVFIHVYEGLIAPNMTEGDFASSDNTGLYLIEAMEYYKGFSQLDNSRPHLNLGYFSCPHVPLCYKADGTPITRKDLDQNKSACYIEYLNWTSKRILDIAYTIQSNDPHSIIIIMSDHGSRMVELESDEQLPDPDYYKKNILNCVYIDSEPLDISEQTGINTLVTVFNKAYGDNLPIREYK